MYLLKTYNNTLFNLNNDYLLCMCVCVCFKPWIDTNGETKTITIKYTLINDRYGMRLKTKIILWRFWRGGVVE